jgi:hypothetical protein
MTHVYRSVHEELEVYRGYWQRHYDLMQAQEADITDRLVSLYPELNLKAIYSLLDREQFEENKKMGEAERAEREKLEKRLRQQEDEKKEKIKLRGSSDMAEQPLIAPSASSSSSSSSSSMASALSSSVSATNSATIGSISGTNADASASKPVTDFNMYRKPKSAIALGAIKEIINEQGTATVEAAGVATAAGITSTVTGTGRDDIYEWHEEIEEEGIGPNVLLDMQSRAEADATVHKHTHDEPDIAPGTYPASFEKGIMRSKETRVKQKSNTT